MSTSSRSVGDESGPSFDILGDQLYAAIAFARSEFSPELELFDSVQSDAVTGPELFEDRRGRWIMRTDSVPGHLALKAIAIDAKTLFLEASPPDEDKLREAIIEENLLVIFDRRARAVLDRRNRRQLFTWTVPVRPKLQGKTEEDESGEQQELPPRCLWLCSWKRLTEEQTDLAVRVMDLAYTREAYDLTAIEEAMSGTLEPGKKPGMRLELSFQQLLQMEQRPELVLTHELETTVETRLEMNLGLLQMFALQTRLVQMSEQELVAWAAEQLKEPGGEDRALKAMHFAIAGKLKRARPELTWKQVRRAAWDLINMRQAV